MNLVLFGLTLLTTTAFGSVVAGAFHSGQPLTVDTLFSAYGNLLRGQLSSWRGLEYSLPVLLILLAHEFGHFFACRHWQVRASLPYFAPSPTLLGTLGAFIRIRSPIYRRKALFDIGVAGPLAGYAILFPFLVFGVWLSRVEPQPTGYTQLAFGTPLLLRLLEYAIFPGAPSTAILLHPVALAAWAGMLATAMNLLPAGQLDGGHLIYAAFGRGVHRVVSFAVMGVLLVLGRIYPMWWVFAVFLFLFRRHPLVHDDASIGRARIWVGLTAFLLFALSFCVAPVRA